MHTKLKKNFDSGLATKRNFGAGFTLIEVTVSIFIIGSIAVASTMLLHGAQLNRVVRDEGLALKIAGRQIEVLRAGGYAALPSSGPFTDSSLSSLASGAAFVTVSSYGAKTKEVEAAVSWLGPDNAPRTISVTTLVTETGGL